MNKTYNYAYPLGFFPPKSIALKSTYSETIKEKNSWDDFSPSDSWQDVLAQKVFKTGLVNQNICIISSLDYIKLPEFSNEQRKAYRNEFFDVRYLSSGAKGEYAWIRALRYLRNHQNTDLHGESLFGKRITLKPKNPARIPSLESVVYIGSGNRKKLFEVGYEQELWSLILNLPVEEIIAMIPDEERKEFVTLGNDRDLRIGLHDTKDFKDLQNTRVVFEKYLGSLSGEHKSIENQGGLFQAEGKTRYYMIRVPDYDENGGARPSIEFIFKMNMREHLASKDRLQTSVTRIDTKCPQLKLCGTKQEILQAALDDLLGIIRIPNHKEVDYYGWIKLMGERTKGRILGFYPGQTTKVESDLLATTIKSRKLHDKLKKCLDKDPNLAFAMCCNAVISLKKHAKPDDSYLQMLWDDLLIHLNDEMPSDPVLNGLWKHLKEKSLSFDDVLTLLQMGAFFLANGEDSSVRITKDGGVPILQGRFGDAKIALPMVSQETLHRFIELISDKKVPETLFSVVKMTKAHPFYKEFSSRLELDLYQSAMSWIQSDHADLSILGLELMIIFHLGGDCLIEAPDLLIKAKACGKQGEVAALLSEHFNEPIYQKPMPKTTKEIHRSFIKERMQSDHLKLSHWAFDQWSHMELEEKLSQYDELIRGLIPTHSPRAFEILTALTSRIDPAKGIEILTLGSSHFDSETSTTLLLAAFRKAFEKQIEMESKLLIKIRDILKTHPEYFEPEEIHYIFRSLAAKLPRECLELYLEMNDEHYEKYIQNALATLGNDLILAMPSFHQLAKLGFFKDRPHLLKQIIESLKKKPKVNAESLKFLSTIKSLGIADQISLRSIYKAYLGQNFSLCLDNFQPAWIPCIDRWLCNKTKAQKEWALYIKLLLKLHQKGKLENTVLINASENLTPKARDYRNPLISLQQSLLNLILKKQLADPDLVFKTVLSIQKHLNLFKKPHRQLKDSLTKASPLIVDLLYQNDPGKLVSLWRSCKNVISINSHVLDLLCRSVLSSSCGDMEEFLKVHFKDLSFKSQKKLIHQLLHFYIVKHNYDRSLELCSLGRKVLGENSEALKELIEKECFTEALAVLDGAISSEDIWRSKIISLVEKGSCFEALELLKKHHNTFASNHELENVLMRLISDRSNLFEISEQLLSICLERKIFFFDLLEPVIYSIPVENDHINHHRLLWDFIIEGLFIQKHLIQHDKAANSFFTHAFRAILTSDPTYCLKLLNHYKIILEMQSQGYLTEYLCNALDVLDDLSQKGKTQYISALAKVVSLDSLHVDIFKQLFLRSFTLFLNCPKLTNQAIDMLLFFLANHEDVFDDKCLETVLNSLIAVKHPDEKILDSIGRLAGKCIEVHEEHEVNIVKLKILELDFCTLFIRLSRDYHKRITSDKILIYPLGPLKIVYWEWFWVFLQPALAFEAPLSDEFIEAASQYLFNCFKFGELPYLSRFLLSTVCRRSLLFEWKILLSVIEKVHNNDSELNGDCLRIFCLAKEFYPKIRSQLSSKQKESLLKSLAFSSTGKFLNRFDLDVLKEEFEGYQGLFFKDECLLLQYQFIKIVQNFHKTLFNGVSQGILTPGRLSDEAIEFCNGTMTSCLDPLMLNLAIQSFPIDAQEYSEYWSLKADCYALITTVDSSRYEKVIESFLNDKGLYKKSRKLLPIDEKKKLIQSLLLLSREFILLDSNEIGLMKFFETLKDIFVDGDDPLVGDYYARCLWEIKSVIPTSNKDNELVFAFLHQKICDHLFPIAVSIVERYGFSSRKRKLKHIPDDALVFLASFASQNPPEAVTLDMGADTEFANLIDDQTNHQNMMKILLEKSAKQKRLYCDNLKSLISKIPSSWHPHIAQIVSSEDYTYEERFNCLSFLDIKKYSKVLDVYVKFIKQFSIDLDKCPDIPFTKLCDSMNMMCCSLLQSSLEGKKYEMRALGLILFQVDFQMILRKAMASLVASQMRFKCALNNEAGLSKDSFWVSPNTFRAHALKRDNELMQQKNHLDLISLNFIFHLIPSLIKISKTPEQEIAIHSPIAKYFEDFVRLATYEMMINPLFMMTILTLQGTYTSEKIAKLYYQVFYHLFLKVQGEELYYAQDEAGNKTSCFEGFLDMMANYKSYVNVSFMKSNAAFLPYTSVSIFIDLVFVNFLEAFPEKKDLIEKYIAIKKEKSS